MALGFFNSLSRQVEEFIPLNASLKRVGLYCCGPTVHDFSHIGNFRTFVFADLVRRYLEYKGFEVDHVMNITDVEDKIIARYQQGGQSLADYTLKYENAFREDLQSLNCRTPHTTPRATGHMAEIIELIGTLLKKGVAYQAPDQSIYFSIDKYRKSGGHYGQLVKLNFEQLRPGERVQHDEYEKESLADFALWKARVPEDGAAFWASPWGEGRPGWHIECSAMSMKYLGPSFDLHLGGEDLAFPHHEDEIAQSEAAGLQPPGHRFVKYWLHAAHLLVEGKKMSKSLGNFFTLRDLTGQGFSGREIRYLLLTAHYRQSFNFTRDGLMAARVSLQGIDQCLGRLREQANGAPPGRSDPALPEAVSRALDEDLNVSAAWAAIHDWIRGLNKQMAAGQLAPDAAQASVQAWEEVNRIFAIPATSQAEAPAEILTLLEERQQARKNRDFVQADGIRKKMEALGWLIEDTSKGSRLKPIARPTEK